MIQSLLKKLKQLKATMQNSDDGMLPFHKWKDNVVKADSKEAVVGLFLREKEWYWKHYGIYCDNYRKKMEK